MSLRRNDVPQLPSAGGVSDTDLFTLSREGRWRRLSASDLVQYILDRGGIGNRLVYSLGKLDGTVNQVPLLNAIFAANPTGNIAIEWSGYMRISSTITPPAGCSNVSLEPAGAGFIYSPSHTFNMIQLPATVAGWNIGRGVKFLTDSGAPGTDAVYAIYNQSNDLTVQDFWARQMFSGIFTSGSKCYFHGRTYVSNLKPSLGDAVVIHMGSAEVCEVENLYAENASGQDCHAGFNVRSGSAIKIGGIAAKCGTPLLVNPQSGEIVATLTIDNFNGDTSSGNAGAFTGAGTIQRVEGTFRGSSCAGHGLFIDNPPRSSDMQCRLVDNGVSGLYMGPGDYQNSRFRLATYGNNVHGAEARPACSNFVVEQVSGAGDDFGGNTQYSAVIGAGSDHFDWKVSGSGDGLGLLSNSAGTSATRVVTTRG